MVTETEVSTAEPELDFDVLGDSVGVQVNLTRRALLQRAAQTRAPGQRRKPSGYITALVMIGANPGVSQKRLADTLVLDAGAIVDIVDLLEAEGIVERRRDPVDRRRMNLFLTVAGETEWQLARDRNVEQDKIVTACLTGAETAQLLELLRRLRRHAAAGGGKRAE